MKNRLFLNAFVLLVSLAALTPGSASADSSAKVVFSNINFIESSSSASSTTDPARVMGIGYAMAPSTLSENKIQIWFPSQNSTSNNIAVVRNRCLDFAEKIFATKNTAPYTLPAFVVEGQASLIKSGGYAYFTFSKIDRCFLTK